MFPQHTAAAIARVRAAEGSRPDSERLFVDPYACFFDDAHADVQAVFDAVPFFVEQVRLRTRFIDDTVRGALAGGVRHIVLVGAGFDARALRMPEIAAAGTRVIEVDYADQIARKQSVFRNHNVAPPAHVGFAPADLAGNIESTLIPELRRAGLPDRADVLWVWEGLVGYLSVEVVERLGRVIGSVSGAGSQIVANYFLPAWRPGVLANALASGGWEAADGPGLDELYRRHIGSGVPSGSEMFAFLIARRRSE